MRNGVNRHMGFGDTICLPEEINVQRASLDNSINALRSDLERFKASGKTLPTTEVNTFLEQLATWMTKISQEVNVVFASGVDGCTYRDWLHEKDSEVRALAKTYSQLTGRSDPILVPQPSIPMSLFWKTVLVGSAVLGGYLLWQHYFSGSARPRTSTYPRGAGLGYLGGRR